MPFIEQREVQKGSTKACLPLRLLRAFEVGTPWGSVVRLPHEWQKSQKGQGV